MEIPPSSHQAWKEVLTGERSCQFEFLGTQLLLKRLCLQVSLKSSPEILDQCVKEFRDMFVSNVSIPKVQRDLEKIFGKGDHHESRDVDGR